MVISTPPPAAGAAAASDWSPPADVVLSVAAAPLWAFLLQRHEGDELKRGDAAQIPVRQKQQVRRGWQEGTEHSTPTPTGFHS